MASQHHVDTLVSMLQELEVEDLLAHGNYSGVFRYWRDTDQMESDIGCAVPDRIPRDVAKRTDIFPRYLVDYVFKMRDVSSDEDITPCFSALEHTDDLHGCLSTRNDIPSLLTCVLEVIIFAEDSEVDDNATIFTRSHTPAVVAGWQFFIASILQEKRWREEHIRRSLASNIAKLQETV